MLTEWSNITTMEAYVPNRIHNKGRSLIRFIRHFLEDNVFNQKINKTQNPLLILNFMDFNNFY